MKKPAIHPDDALTDIRHLVKAVAHEHHGPAGGVKALYRVQTSMLS